MMRHYPLPGYIGSNNYIETDIEISKFYLSSIRNGMMPSKMLQFYIGDPGEEKKKEIEARFAKKFSGAENAGKFVMVFNPAGPEKKIEISDLSGSELDKMFVELNKTVQQEIYAGHGITSPMLFGIKTEGQLGGSTELRMAYEIFQNTYAKPKAKALDREVTYLMGFAAAPAEYELRPTDPIGVQFDVATIIDKIPTEFIFEKLGIPYTPQAPVASTPEQMVNEHIKNMTGRQWQHVERIQRNFKKGKITEAQARLLLKNSYGLSDEDINTFLGIVPVHAAKFDTDDDIIALFDQFGDDKGDYEVIKSKRVCFSIDQIEDDEEIYSQEAFRTITDLSRTEASIISLIKKDPRIPAKDIANAIGQTEAYVKNKIGVLTKRGWIESSTELIGSDSVDVRTIVEDKVPPTPEKAQPAQIFIKYSYEGPQDSRNRPFCAKMMQLNRLYSRREIELISERLGYSVFDRRGGFWNKGGEILPHCRHKWQSNIVVRKPSDK
jgi:DNA-binding Lrp family transcriptional regulator